MRVPPIESRILIIMYVSVVCLARSHQLKTCRVQNSRTGQQNCGRTWALYTSKKAFVVALIDIDIGEFWLDAGRSTLDAANDEKLSGETQ